MNTGLKYIIVDDDTVSNIISCMIIRKTLGETDIETFSVPENGLSYLEDNHQRGLAPAILLLDINMPSISAWEFLEQYEKFCGDTEPAINIYILSSSVDPRDIEKANKNKYVKGFMSKPLEKNAIISITEKVFQIT